MFLFTITELVTHDGKFHADEVLATVILSDLFPSAKLIRSRNRELIAPAPGRLIYDVGGAFDPGQGLFDHHQSEAPRRECGTPYSAFGLIWREFGHRWLAECMKAEQGEEAFRRIDEDLVRVVDAVDNGKLAPIEAGRFDGLTTFSMISDFVPGWREESESKSRLAFERAVSFASTFLKLRVRAILAELEASIIVRGRIGQSDGPILVLQQGMP